METAHVFYFTWPRQQGRRRTSTQLLCSVVVWFSCFLNGHGWWGCWVWFPSEWLLLLMLLSHFSHAWLCATPWTEAYQAPRPWDSPGRNTGVGCHFLLQRMKVKSESEVAQSCPTLRDPTMDCSLPGSSVHGIFQARVLEWGAIAFSVTFDR